MSRYDRVSMVIAGRATDADDLRLLLSALAILPDPTPAPAPRTGSPARRPRKRTPRALRTAPTVLAVCGKRHGYERHLLLGQEPCEPCKQANRDYHNARNQKIRESRPPRELAPCGTDAAAQRHTRLGEPLDPACVEARRAATRERVARYKARKAAAAGGAE